MTRAFERRGDAIRMRLEPREVALLRRMRDELHGVLLEVPGDDPVRARLFPPAVTGDDDADTEVRGMIHDELLESRLAALDDLVGYLDRGEQRRGRVVVDLVDEEPAVVLGVLNDVRLALGARVGFDTVEARDDLDDPSLHASLAVMDWFAMWQEQLLVAMDPSVAAHYDHPHDTEE